MIHLKQLSCKVIFKGLSWEDGGSFFSWSFSICHVTIGDIFNILFGKAQLSLSETVFSVVFFKQPDFSSSFHVGNLFLFFHPLFYSMATPCDILLTSSNYFSWKSRMEYVLRSRGLVISRFVPSFYCVILSFL